MPADRSGEVHEQPGLSEDALIVQTVTADLQRAGVTSDVFGMVQRHGYLRDWDQDRWLQAEAGTRASTAAPGTSALPGDGYNQHARGDGGGGR